MPTLARFAARSAASRRLGYGLLLASLAWGCSVQFSPWAIISPKEHSPDTGMASRGNTAFAYAIDPLIAGRYGVPGEVAWSDAGNGRRPAIFALEQQSVTFEPGATNTDVEHFLRDFAATLDPRPDLHGFLLPDPRILDAVRCGVTFDTAQVNLENLRSLGSDVLPGSSFLCSSERAAKILYQLLKARQQAATYRIQVANLTSWPCKPSECDPDGSPLPVFPQVPALSSPAPEPKVPFHIEPMLIESFDCGQPRTPDKNGAIKIQVNVVLRDGCVSLHEINATVDEERREVHLGATQEVREGICTQAYGFEMVEAKFYPKSPGTYQIVGTVTPKDNSGDREEHCALTVLEHALPVPSESPTPP